MKLVNEIKRATANLIVNPANVFAQQSRANKLHTAKKQNSQKCANVSRSRDDSEIFQVEYRVPQIHQREKQCERQHDSSQNHSQPQWLIAEAENCVHGVLEQLGERLLGFARGPSGALVINNCCGKADPSPQPGKIAVSFGKIIDCIGCLPVEQAENS